MTDKELAIYIGTKIKEYRLQRGLTQKELATLVDMGDTTIANYEKGFRTPKKNTLFKISSALSVTIDDLFPPIRKADTPTASPDSLTQQITDKVVQLTPDNKKIVLRTSEELLERQKANGEMYTEQNEEETKKNEVSENIIRLDDYRQTTYRRVTGVVSAGSGSMQDDDLDMEVSFYDDEIPDDYDAIAYVVGNSMEPKIKNGDYLFIKNTPQVDYNTIGIFQVDGANYVKKLRQGYLESLNPECADIHLDESNDIRTIGEVVSVYREK
ncbi:helix-turn-helix domain-containing protein [Streptococcus sp. SPS1]|uniref:helix-turn-helix domain-containing protein n=1 Tax=Streptococcus sp. SPS1 TaxID=3018247 RepID=UPI00263CDBED|nr:S24 family peptidase [Streptococcus sp. SPS1]MDN5026547.1 helix-turn-helix domain-containing protein [Streptococcus sp. SPS1]